jgi:hypothetical protein
MRRVRKADPPSAVGGLDGIEKRLGGRKRK